MIFLPTLSIMKVWLPFMLSAIFVEPLDETAKLQSQIDAVSAAGGGKVEIPAGIHWIRPIELKSGVELCLAEGARLLGSGDWKDYPDHKLRHSDSTKCPRGRASSLIWADEATNIAITGKGTLDGNGACFLTNATPEQLAWGFKYVRRGGTKESPPRMILLAGCSNVRVAGVTFTGLPGGWAVWLHDCDHAVFDGVKVDADVNCANNDGIHVNCSRDVLIRNCDITTGDDAIVVRANSRSLRENRVCERVTVTNCNLRSWSCGVRIGWCNDGTIRECVFEDLRIRDSTFGVGIVLPPKRWIPSDYGREATRIENLIFRDITLDGIYAHPLYCRTWDDPDSLFDGIRDILFENIRGYGLENPYFEGTPTRPFERFTFLGCSWKTVGEDILPGSGLHGAAARERFTGGKMLHTKAFQGSFLGPSTSD